MKHLIILVSLVLFSCSSVLSHRELISAVSDSIYMIRTQNEVGQFFYGTCFAYASKPIAIQDSMYLTYKTYFMTNAHNVEDIDTTKTTNVLYRPSESWRNIPDQLPEDKTLVYTIEAFDKELDIAIVSVISGYEIPVLELETDGFKQWDPVFSLGYPMSTGIAFSEGYVEHYIDHMGRWTVSAPITFGNSGGPVMSKDTGRVIGVTVSIAAINMGFSTAYIWHLHQIIPTTNVFPLLEEKGLK